MIDLKLSFRQKIISYFENLHLYNHQFDYIHKILEHRAVYLGAVTGTMPYYTTPISIHLQGCSVLVDFRRLMEEKLTEVLAMKTRKPFHDIFCALACATSVLVYHKTRCKENITDFCST